MPSNFRIPKAPPTGAYARVMTVVAQRMWGEVPDNAHVLLHNKPVLKAIFGFEGKVAKWKALDPDLKTYAVMASAATIGCSWCLDFGYFLAHNDGLDLAKIREVPRWRDSDVFSDLERDVMEYAEAMTQTPPTVTDELAARLLDRLGAPAMVELTTWIAMANQFARGNVALGIEAEGFAASCGLAPLVQPSGVASRA